MHARARRVFVLGIDGVPFTLAQRFCEEGVMPRLAALAARGPSLPPPPARPGEAAPRRMGALAQMDSCLPTVSNVAWSVFQTGLNPGAFGIYGFAELTPERRLRVPTAADLKAPTLWQILSEAGRRVIALGVPQTYPPKPVNGIVVGCFLAPRLEGAVYPPELIPRLRQWGYATDVDPMKARESLDYLKRDLLHGLEGRERTVFGLLESEPWDLFVAHVMETDRINHFMWHALERPDSDDGRFFRDFYARLDAFIGRLADRLPDADFLICSDHGFCAVKREVQLNRWLVQRGYQRCHGPAEDGFAALCGDALALVPGRVHLLRSGMYVGGEVSAGQADEVRRRLATDLAGLRDPATGDPVCRRVLRREELFEGPFTDRAPDLVVEPHDGYDLKASLGEGPLFTTGPITGMHTRDDALLLFRGRNLPNVRPSLFDLAPSLLRLLGVEHHLQKAGRMLF